jgi:hypothetical protein
MMAPEVTDIWSWLLAIMGTGSGGAVILAVLGWLKARNEKPHIAPPSVGGGALAQIGGMVMGQQDLRDLVEALRAMAASHDRCTLVRETEMEVRKKLAKERREHEIEMEERRHDDYRPMLDQMKTLCDRLRDVRIST